ncbi:MAG: hypothetical protein JO069_19360 [Verrucomicrobia bacterium]|nr:hypothetical protein [Verrucomicrobiota bacterium]
MRTEDFPKRFNYLGNVKHRITLALEETIANNLHMRIHMFALALGLTAVSAAQDDPRKIDVYNLFPNVGTMIVEAEPNDAGVPSGILGDCPATLIHERVLLTAGHCTRRSEFGTLPFIHVYFSFSLHAFDDRSTWIPVEAQAWHPSTLPCFASPSGCSGDPPVPGFSDVGLLLLPEDLPGPVKHLRPDLLASPGTLDLPWVQKQEQVIVGYGFRNSAPGGGPPPWSQWDGIRRYRLKMLDYVIDDRWAQWVYPTDTCFADSGGPVFLGPLGDSDREQRYIVAVTSGFKGSTCPNAAINARVDNEDVQRWIAQQIREWLRKPRH